MCESYVVYYEVAAMARELKLGMQHLDKTDAAQNKHGMQVMQKRRKRSEGLDKFIKEEEVESLLLRVSVSVIF